MDIKVDKIAKVRKTADGDWEITKEDGWSIFLDSKYDIVPEVGQEIKILHHWGNQIHGIQIEGKNAFWKSKEQADAEHEQWKKGIREKHTKEYQKLMGEIKGEKEFCTIDISGMGGGYERACQLMLKAGIQYLANKSNFVWDYEEYANVYGVCWSDSENAKRLDKVLLYAAGGDCSGAMHQAVIGHLRFIHENSYDKWLNECGKDRQYIYPKELPAHSF